MFYAGEETLTVETVEPAPKKDFPYYIASRSNEFTAPKTDTKISGLYCRQTEIDLFDSGGKFQTRHE